MRANALTAPAETFKVLAGCFRALEVRDVEHGIGHGRLSERVFKLTGIAAKQVVAGIAGDGRKRGTKFIIDPATGALELPADLRLKVIKSLRREARGLQFRAYLSLPRLYVCKLGLKCRYAVIGAGGQFLSYLLKFTRERHDQRSF